MSVNIFHGKISITVFFLWILNFNRFVFKLTNDLNEILVKLGHFKPQWDFPDAVLMKQDIFFGGRGVGQSNLSPKMLPVTDLSYTTLTPSSPF